MREVALLVGCLGFLPIILTNAQAGVLVWTWFNIMNPHRETYGFTTTLPFNWIVLIFTMMAWLSSKERRAPPMTALNWVIIIYAGWMIICCANAFYPQIAFNYYWFLPAKIFLFLFIVITVMHTRTRIMGMIWVIVISLGYFGVRNAAAIIIQGGKLGSFQNVGPAYSMIADRNHLSLALVMILPLLFFLWRHSQSRGVRRLVAAVMAATVLAVVGMFSRGGFLSLMAILVFLWWKTPRKMVSAGALLVLIVPAILLMPDSWSERMDFSKVMQDQSFQERLGMWDLALRIASDYPLTGGGFKASEQPATLLLYPVADGVARAMHSIYFQTIHDTGYVGLGLFLSIFFLAWRTSSWIMRNAAGRPDLTWTRDLASMIQVSLIGYAIGGAALSLAYYDGYYMLIGLLILTREYVARELGLVSDKPRWRRATTAETKPPLPAPQSAV